MNLIKKKKKKVYSRKVKEKSRGKPIPSRRSHVLYQKSAIKFFFPPFDVMAFAACQCVRRLVVRSISCHTMIGRTWMRTSLCMMLMDGQTFCHPHSLRGESCFAEHVALMDNPAHLLTVSVWRFALHSPVNFWFARLSSPLQTTHFYACHISFFLVWKNRWVETVMGSCKKRRKLWWRKENEWKIFRE